jgi:o-succinylbenzoate---CoA ligase
VTDTLHEAARRFGEAPALVGPDGGSLSFRAWHERALEAPVPPEPVVGLVASPDPEFAVSLVAAWRAGRVVCLLSAHDPPERRATLLAGVQGTGPAIVLFTSGSLGFPRAILHGFETLGAGAEAACRRVPFAPGDRWAATLPLHHVGGLGLLFRALAGGGAVVFGSTWRDALAKPGITHASLVAPQLPAVRERGSLRAILVGGGATPVPMLEGALAAGLPILPTYGSTELGSQVCTVVPPARREDLGSAGPPLDHAEIRIGEGGEIAVRASSLGRGLADSEGFYATADLGDLDERGNLWVRGRRDLTFVSGGEKVAPEEVEAVLLAMPGVREAVVVGVPHRRWGTRPVAWVDADDVDGLAKAMSGRLPAYLVPDRFVPLPPDCPGWPGKRDRRWLQARAARE